MTSLKTFNFGPYFFKGSTSCYMIMAKPCTILKKVITYVDTKSNNVNSNNGNVVAINQKPLHFSFLENCRNWIQDETSKLFLFGNFPSASKTILSVSFTLLIRME